MEKENFCMFLKTCAFGTSACNTEQAALCGEFFRRQILAQTPCPIMADMGYNGELAKCDSPDLRAQVPSEKSCRKNGRCIREELCHKFFFSYLRLYGEKRFVELRKPIKICLES
ncbi:MAG: hypothetical protein V1667_02690 [bacterium]